MFRALDFPAQKYHSVRLLHAAPSSQTWPSRTNLCGVVTPLRPVNYFSNIIWTTTAVYIRGFIIHASM